MRAFAEKPKSTMPGRAHFGQSHDLQSTIGNQAMQRRLQQAKAADLEARSTPKEVTRFAHDFSQIPVHAESPASVQTKLTVSPAGDIYEQEADRVAEQVMRTPEPQLQRACACGGGCPKCQAKQPGGEHERLQTKRVQASDAGQIAAPSIVHEVLRSPGQSLDPATRAFMEQRFGYDFSRVRVHTDAAAEHSARDVNAHAYTVGNDIVFGAGRFASGAQEGRRLIAHELTHVVQQRQRTGSVLQRAALQDYNDRDVRHDPSKLTDAQIEATNEFKSYTDSKLVWQWKYNMTREEALLACRLLLRRLREGERVNWMTDAVRFMNLARKQLSTLKETEKLVGKLEWSPVSEEQLKDPDTDRIDDSDFTEWLLAGGPEPTDLSKSKMNCWEMILFGAFRGNVASKDRLRNIYREASRKGNPPAEIEKQLCGGSSVTFNPKDPNSPEPLPGDIIVFDVIKNHAAISLGTTAIGGDHLVISLHSIGVSVPNRPGQFTRPLHNPVQIITLE